MSEKGELKIQAGFEAGSELCGKCRYIVPVCFAETECAIFAAEYFLNNTGEDRRCQSCHA